MTATKKKLLVALGALVSVAAIVVTTVMITTAFLTSSAAVSNVFTIGKVNITMDESKVDENGEYTDGGVTRVDTNTYKLVPGKTYIKDPVIHVDNESIGSYLFVLVRNDIESIEDNTADDETLTIAEQLAAKGWAKYTPASTGWVYVYVGVGNVPAGDADKKLTDPHTFEAVAAEVSPGDYKLFDNFTLADNADVSKMGAAKVTLTAVAIQGDEFENNIDAAWAKVKEAYPYIHTGTN